MRRKNARRRQRAQHQAATVDEPAAGDGRGQHRCHAARAKADDDTPQQVELPGGCHHRGQQRARRNRDQRADRHGADAEAVHERGGEWPRESEQEEVDEDGEGDDRPVPAELVLQGNDQHAGRRAESRGAHQRHEGHRGDDPRVVDAFQWEVLRGQRDSRLVAISLAWRAVSGRRSREAVTIAPSISTMNRLASAPVSR